MLTLPLSHEQRANIERISLRNSDTSTWPLAASPQGISTRITETEEKDRKQETNCERFEERAKPHECLLRRDLINDERTSPYEQSGEIRGDSKLEASLEIEPTEGVATNHVSDAGRPDVASSGNKQQQRQQQQKQQQHQEHHSPARDPQERSAETGKHTPLEQSDKRSQSSSLTGVVRFALSLPRACLFVVWRLPISLLADLKQWLLERLVRRPLALLISWPAISGGSSSGGCPRFLSSGLDLAVCSAHEARGRQQLQQQQQQRRRRRHKWREHPWWSGEYSVPLVASQSESEPEAIGEKEEIAGEHEHTPDSRCVAGPAWPVPGEPGPSLIWRTMEWCRRRALAHGASGASDKAQANKRAQQHYGQSAGADGACDCHSRPPLGSSGIASGAMLAPPQSFASVAANLLSSCHQRRRKQQHYQQQQQQKQRAGLNADSAEQQPDSAHHHACSWASIQPSGSTGADHPRARQRLLASLGAIGSLSQSASSKELLAITGNNNTTTSTSNNNNNNNESNNFYTQSNLNNNHWPSPDTARFGSSALQVSESTLLLGLADQLESCLKRMRQLEQQMQLLPELERRLNAVALQQHQQQGTPGSSINSMSVDQSSSSYLPFVASSTSSSSSQSCSLEKGAHTDLQTTSSLQTGLNVNHFMRSRSNLYETYHAEPTRVARTGSLRVNSALDGGVELAQKLREGPKPGLQGSCGPQVATQGHRDERQPIVRNPLSSSARCISVSRASSDVSSSRPRWLRHPASGRLIQIGLVEAQRRHQQHSHQTTDCLINSIGKKAPIAGDSLPSGALANSQSGLSDQAQQYEDLINDLISLSYSVNQQQHKQQHIHSPTSAGRLELARRAQATADYGRWPTGNTSPPLAVPSDAGSKQTDEQQQQHQDLQQRRTGMSNQRASPAPMSSSSCERHVHTSAGAAAAGATVSTNRQRGAGASSAGAALASSRPGGAVSLRTAATSSGTKSAFTNDQQQQQHVCISQSAATMSTSQASIASRTNSNSISSTTSSSHMANPSRFPLPRRPFGHHHHSHSHNNNNYHHHNNNNNNNNNNNSGHQHTKSLQTTPVKQPLDCGCLSLKEHNRYNSLNREQRLKSQSLKSDAATNTDLSLTDDEGVQAETDTSDFEEYCAYGESLERRTKDFMSKSSKIPNDLRFALIRLSNYLKRYSEPTSSTTGTNASSSSRNNNSLNRKGQIGAPLASDLAATGCLDTVRQKWFNVAAQKDSQASRVKLYVEYMASFGQHLQTIVVNLTDSAGNTALHYAASYLKLDIIKMLLDTQNCDIDFRNRAGYTPIMLLSLTELERPDDKQVARLMFTKGDVNIKARSSGQTALMLAASHGRLSTCELLLDCGADPSLQDRDGSTALMCGSEIGNEQIVQCLLKHKLTDYKATDNDGLDAMTIAENNGHTAVVAILKTRQQSACQSDIV